MKSTLGYILIFIGIALAICLVMMAYLILFPNAILFGYKYINMQSDAGNFNFISETELQSNSLKNIVINASGYEVYVGFDEDSIDNNKKNIETMHMNRIIGFYSNYKDLENSVPNMSYELTDNDTVTITMNEPKGLILKNSSFINVYLPKCVGTFTNIIVNTDGGYINVGENNKTKIKTTNLEINAKEFAQVNLTNLDVSDSTKISIENGTVNCSSDLSIYGTVELYSVYGNFNFNSIGGTTITGNNPKFNAKNIHATLTINTDNGTYNINNITNTLLIDSTECIINVNDIFHGCSVNVDKLIMKVNALKNDSSTASSINSSTGNIQIESCLTDLVVNTTRTQVLINNAGANIEVNSTHSDIIIADASNSSHIKATNNRGHIKIDKVNNTVNITNNLGNTNVSFLNVNGISKIVSSAPVTLDCPVSKFTLAVRGENKNISLGSIDENSSTETFVYEAVSYDKYLINYDGFDNSVYESNIITISSSGKIEVK